MLWYFIYVKRAASQLLGAGLLLCLGSHFLPFFDAGGLLVRCIGDLIQLKTEGFLFCFIYCCLVFLPDWVLTVAICRSADAGVKRMSGEVKKSNDVSAASGNSRLFKVREWDCSLSMCLQGSWSWMELALLLLCLPLPCSVIVPFYFRWALALNQFRKPHWQKQLFFSSGLFARLVSEQDPWVPVLTQERGWVWRMLT